MCCVCVPALWVYFWPQDEKTEAKTSSPPTTGPAGVAKATAVGGVAKENGVKEPTATPFGGDGLREHSIDKRITETSGCQHTHTQSVVKAMKRTSVIIAN